MADQADFSDLNPAFASRLDAFKAALDKQGIGYGVVSGYRSPEYQNRMYQNHLAKKASRSLPYPNDEAPDVVAPAWRSFHNYGLAADFTGPNLARIRALAPQFGLSGIGASDPGHIQLAGTLDQNVKQYSLANWRPSSQPAPDQGAIAYTGGPPSPPATLEARAAPAQTQAQGLVFGGLNPNARGMRNNNPGNLEANSWTSGLPGYKGSDGRFAIFDTPQHGAEALDQNLTSYAGKGINTPLGVASAWAPGSEKGNDPNSYGSRIAAALGVKLGDKIDLTNPTVRAQVAQAIGRAENGPGNSPGFGMTLNTSGQPPGASGTTAGGPAAPAAPGQPGQAPFGSAGNLPGFTPDSPAAKMTADGLKSLGLGDKGGDKGGQGDDYPQMPPPPPSQPAMPVGGPMMMGAGGQNTMGQRVAQQEYNLQPNMANYVAGGTRMPSLNALPPGAMQAPGSATGLTGGLPGTTLNSPSQLQTALMYGSLDPFDPYGRNNAQNNPFAGSA